MDADGLPLAEDVDAWLEVHLAGGSGRLVAANLEISEVGRTLPQNTYFNAVQLT